MAHRQAPSTWPSFVCGGPAPQCASSAHVILAGGPGDSGVNVVMGLPARAVRPLAIVRRRRRRHRPARHRAFAPEPRNDARYDLPLDTAGLRGGVATAHRSSQSEGRRRVSRARHPPRGLQHARERRRRGGRAAGAGLRAAHTLGSELRLPSRARDRRPAPGNGRSARAGEPGGSESHMEAAVAGRRGDPSAGGAGCNGPGGAHRQVLARLAADP